MLGLLQAYGSSDESSSESEKEQEEEAPQKPSSSKLPNPFELPSPNMSTSSKDKILEKSVFVNQFVKAEQQEKTILEKHVKMISTDFRVLNGKKICWNYRKKKCRFGHNCKYAHDSDLHSADGPSEPERKPDNEFRQAPIPEKHEVVDESTILAKGKKRRPGLSQTVVPSKKVMDHYYRVKDK